VTEDEEELARWARLRSMTALASAARWYAAQGWPVFPLVPGDKVPLTEHGFKDATTLRRQVDRCWSATPQANIGTPTGVLFDVIDVDGPPGFASIGALYHDACAADCCATSTCTPNRRQLLGHEVLAVAYTGGGGRHLLIAPTGQPNAAGLGGYGGIDYRGNGGYVVLPPSRHPSGRLYDWLIAPDERLTA
jgi:hypothetical protein